MREATGSVDSVLNIDVRELNPAAMSLYHGWLLFHDINSVPNDLHVQHFNFSLFSIAGSGVCFCF